MKLLYFTRADSLHDRRFLAAFREHGVQVGCITLQDLPAPVKGMPGYKTNWLGSLGCKAGATDADYRAAALRLARVAAEFVPDLVVAGPLTDCGYVAAHSGLACPWILQSWAFDVYWEAEHEVGAKQRVHAALQACEVLFADSHAVLEHCEALAGRPMKTAFLMPWGIEPRAPAKPALRESLRRDLGIAHPRKVFLHNRHLEPVYSVPTVLEAFRDLRDLDPTVMLLLASGGSLRQEIERLVTSHGLANDVLILGGTTPAYARDLLASADVFVSHAASDGTSISLLEAMAAGLPAIVSDCGGNREWVRPGVNGWVVPRGDTMRLTAAMIEAAESTAAEREAMGQAGRQLVLNRADWRVNFPRYLEFLRAQVRGAGSREKGAI